MGLEETRGGGGGCGGDAAARGLALARCAAPTIRGHSAYTVLGFVGYGIASSVVGVLAALLELSLVDRLIIVFGPPLAFLVMVRRAKRRAGYERIVFYEVAVAAFALTGGVAACAGAHLGSVLDLVAIGIGYFLVFGRFGCFRVACCHGRPVRARFGVRYGSSHVAVGFPELWRGRPIVPVQLVEAAATLVLATVAVVLAFGEAGDGAAAYVVGYAVVRFSLEPLRGDRDRRYWRGLTEAQRMAALSAAAAAVLHPQAWTMASALLLALVAAVVIATHRGAAAQLLCAPHIHEVGDRHAAMLRGNCEITSAGLSISQHALPDGRTDFIWSREAGLPERVARRLATLVDPDADVIPGRSPNLIHVVVASR